MIGWLRRHMGFLDRRTPRVVPEDPEQAAVLAHADRLLAHPKVRMLETRNEQMRGSFRRAGDRLATR